MFETTGVAGLNFTQPTSPMAPTLGNPAGAPGSDASMASALPPASDPNSILGMTPASFASLAGGMGAALAPKDSWQSRLGEFAKGVGTAQLASLAAQKKAKADQAQFGLLMDKYGKSNPGMMEEFIKMSGQPGLTLNPGVAPPQTGGQ